MIRIVPTKPKPTRSPAKLHSISLQEPPESSEVNACSERPEDENQKNFQSAVNDTTQSATTKRSNNINLDSVNKKSINPTNPKKTQ
jgi:hypothetical protein